MELTTTKPLIVRESDLTWNEGKPFINDERLGQLLGFKHPRQIKRIIKRYLPQLEQLGIVYRSSTLSPVGIWGGQQATETFDMEIAPAVYVITKCATPRSADLTVDVVRLAVAAAKAQGAPFKAPQLPPPVSPALPPALLRSLAQERLRARPEWRKIRGYARRGFQTGEIAKVMGISSGKVGAALSQMRQLGLIETAGLKHVPA
jgi:hypothetical protein